MLNNQRGVSTLSFIIALVIGFGFSAILFAMSITLMVVEVTQYVTFSSARAHAAANKDPQDQIDAAREKYDRLTRSAVLAPLYSNGWFEVSNKGSLEVRSGNVGLGGQTSFKDEYPPASGANKDIWTGVRTRFVTKVLSMNLPMVGRTTEDDEGLSTRIMTILIREPSQNECQKFMKDRYAKMLSLDPRFSVYASHGADYLALEDNGC